MSWLFGEGARRRPLVFVDDHLYHIGETLELLARQAPELLRLLTAVCLDRPGPDTRRAVAAWLAGHPTVRVAACASREELASPPRSDVVERFTPLPDDVFSRPLALSETVRDLLRPGGLLLQDVQLETLAFIPRDRWWESFRHLAVNVRGMFAERPPACWFLSNKEGYRATFGTDLARAGFDPETSVLDKRQLGAVLVPGLRRFLAERLPLRLQVTAGGRALHDTAVGPEDRPAAESALDLVLWRHGDRLCLGGRALGGGRLRFKPGAVEGATWQALIDDRIDRPQGAGVATAAVGRRLAPEDAGAAEISNCAARHILKLRQRLDDRAAIQTTAEHTYRLDDRLRLGRASDVDAG